jgi:hypothetical protein
MARSLVSLALSPPLIRFAIAVMIVPIASGCAADRPRGDVGGDEVAWTDATRWTLEEDLTIGVAEGAEEYQFGHVADVEVGPNGRIYVLDQQAGEVRAYEADGAYAFTFGRPGRGPGELGNNIPLGANAIHRAPGGELLIPDLQNNRVSRFAADGAFLGSFPLRLEEGLPGTVAVLGIGEYALQRTTTGATGVAERAERAGWSGVLRLDSAGAVVDTILTFPERGPPPLPPGRTPALTHSGVWTTLSDGSVVAGFSDNFRLEVRAPDGGLVRVIGNDDAPVPLSRREQERFLERLLELWAEMFRGRGESEGWIAEQLREGRRLYALPEFAPAFTALAPGPEGTLWVQRALPVDSMTGAILQGAPLRAFAGSMWEVYSREGRPLGVVTVPHGFTLLKIRGQHVYGRQRGEFDVQHVVRLRIRMPGR